MQPAFGRQHRLPQKWPESMYLLDKKIYLKFHQIEKILSGPNRRVPNPGFWQNKVQFSRQSIRHTTPELLDTFGVDHHFTMQMQSHNARFPRWKHDPAVLIVCLRSTIRRFLDTSEQIKISDFGSLIFLNKILLSMFV